MRCAERDGLARAGSDAIAASGAGGFVDDGLRRQSNAGLETKRRRSTGIAAGAADDAGFGEAVAVNDGDRSGKELTAKQRAARGAWAFHGDFILPEGRVAPRSAGSSR